MAGMALYEAAGKIRDIVAYAVNATLHRVRRYQFGQAILRATPLSLRGLAQTGIIRESTARALEAEGITDIRQIAEQGKRYIRTIDGLGLLTLMRLMAIMKRRGVPRTG
jgi:hypothetical protein